MMVETWTVQHNDPVLVPQNCHDLQCNKGVFLLQIGSGVHAGSATCWLYCQNHYIATYCPYDSWSDSLLHCNCQVQNDPSVCLFVAAGCRVTFIYGLCWKHTGLERADKLFGCFNSRDYFSKESKELSLVLWMAKKFIPVSSNCIFYFYVFLLLSLAAV